MGLVETEAIVLHTFKLAEADKIAVCMTEKAGLVRGVAHGARRMKSKFGASLEPFTLINLTYFEKEARELVTIKNTEILRSYFGSAESSEAIASMGYLVELVKEFATPHHADERLFRMLRACVESIANDAYRSQAIFAYCELWILKLTGFLPDFKICGGCGEHLKERTSSGAYITNEGIVWCTECYRGGGRLINEEVYGLLYATRALRPAKWSKAYSETSASNQQAISSISRGLIKRVLEKDVRGNHQTFQVMHIRHLSDKQNVSE
jgi:DNA repair protein RecO (recombination protein O)